MFDVIVSSESSVSTPLVHWPLKEGFLRIFSSFFFFFELGVFDSLKSECILLYHVL